MAAPQACAQETAAQTISTPVHVQESHASSEQKSLAKQQGAADTAVLDWVLANSGGYKGDVRAGQMRLAFTVTPAEGWWTKTGNGQLAWHDAPDDAVHLRVFALDLVDGRVIPGLGVRAVLTDANGNEQTVALDYGWYPLMNAYGANVPMDADGRYTIRVMVDAYAAHRENTPAEHATVAEFAPVQISMDAIDDMPLATATEFANEPELLKPANAALSAAITALWQQSAVGAEKPAGDYFVGYALGSTGMAVQVAGAKIRPKSLIDFSGKAGAKVTVVPRDARTGRFIPNLKVQATLVADDKPDGPGMLTFSWHPWLQQYQAETRVSRKGVYKLRVHFDAPGFRRWGRESERFALPADVEFDNVSLKPE